MNRRRRGRHQALFEARQRLGFLAASAVEPSRPLSSASGGFDLARKVKRALDPQGIIATGRAACDASGAVNTAGLKPHSQARI